MSANIQVAGNEQGVGAHWVFLMTEMFFGLKLCVRNPFFLFPQPVLSIISSQSRCSHAPGIPGRHVWSTWVILLPGKLLPPPCDCLTLKYMSLTISQVVHEWCSQGCLLLMWLSRAGERPVVAEFQETWPLCSIQGFKHLVPALDLSRISRHRQSYCSHPCTSLNSWRSRTQPGHL